MFDANNLVRRIMFCQSIRRGARPARCNTGRRLLDALAFRANRLFFQREIMPSDEGEKSKARVNLSVGKKIDEALGDVIRGLLKKPAEEAGNLMADGIGILGDRVRRKRLLNAQIGLEETRAILEGKDIELKDITPPSEEDLQILLDGMSLSADDRIRKLWSGLLASALDPDEARSIERPFTSAISSLSPADARVIEYVAFVTKNDRSIRNDARKAAGVENKGWLTQGDADRIEKERRAMSERLEKFMEVTSQMEADFDLVGISSQPDWSDNLTRLGIIRPRPDEYSPTTRSPSIRGMDIDGRDVAEIIKFVEERISEAEGLALEGLEIRFLSKRYEQDQRIDLGIELTRFGEKLCQACGLM